MHFQPLVSQNWWRCHLLSRPVRYFCILWYARAFQASSALQPINFDVCVMYKKRFYKWHSWKENTWIKRTTCEFWYMFRAWYKNTRIWIVIASRMEGIPVGAWCSIVWSRNTMSCTCHGQLMLDRVFVFTKIVIARMRLTWRWIWSTKKFRG